MVRLSLSHTHTGTRTHINTHSPQKQNHPMCMYVCVGVWMWMCGCVRVCGCVCVGVNVCGCGCGCLCVGHMKSSCVPFVRRCVRNSWIVTDLMLPHKISPSQAGLRVCGACVCLFVWRAQRLESGHKQHTSSSVFFFFFLASPEAGDANLEQPTSFREVQVCEHRAAGLGYGAGGSERRMEERSWKEELEEGGGGRRGEE